jgi:hypothetical protein
VSSGQSLRQEKGKLSVNEVSINPSLRSRDELIATSWLNMSLHFRF